MWPVNRIEGKGVAEEKKAQTKQEVKVMCQPFKLSSEGAQPLTPWMGIDGRMSAAIQIELRRCTATHSLDGN